MRPPALPEPVSQTNASTKPVPPFPQGTTFDSPNVPQPGANGIDHQLRSLMNSQRVHNVRPMDGNGVGAQIECRLNLLIRLAVDDHLQHLQFALCKGGATLALQYGSLLDLRLEYCFSGSHLADRGAELQVHRVF